MIEDDEDTKMIGDSAGSADASQKAPPALPVKRRPMLKVPAVLKSAPSMVTRAPPPVERWVVPKEPAVVPTFDISDFPMTLPGLPSSIASSPATTLAPETPTSKAPIGRLPSTTSSPKPMGPPPVQGSSPKPKPPTREQVQIEVDTTMREEGGEES